MAGAGYGDIFLHKYFIHITPAPVFTGLEGFYYGMFGGVKMFGGVLIFGRVTATHVATT